MAHPLSSLHPLKASSLPTSSLIVRTSSWTLIPIRRIVVSDPIPISISSSLTKGKQYHLNVKLDSDNECNMTIMNPQLIRKVVQGKC